MQPENLILSLKLRSFTRFVIRTAFALLIAGLTIPLLTSASAFTCNEVVNVALAANGATVTASSSVSGFAPSGAINGDRKGLFLWQDGYWSTSSAGAGWLEVQFNGSKTISEIDVVTVQNNYNAPVEPTDAMTFSSYGLTAFEVQYWTGSTWATISGGSITGNNKVWRKFSFAAITTTKIRVLANASSDGFGRLTYKRCRGRVQSSH